MKVPKDELDAVKRIMGALVHMPPKHHDEMKLGKPRAKRSLGKVDTKSTKAKKKPDK